jgi:hypothetical protein
MRAPDQAGSFPDPPQWAKQLLIGLFVVYVAELVLNAAGLPILALAWYPTGQGFAPWQLLTRFLVQGPGVVGVLVALFVAWFIIPVLEQVLRRDQLAEATAAMAAGATILPLVADATGLFQGSVILGWTSFITGWVVLFGLAQPDGEVRLYFVLPVTGRMIVWGSLGLYALFLLAAPVTASLEPIGVWAGAYAWWSYRGPGARQRYLRQQAGKVERELRRFEVLDGGKSDSQSGDNRDGWVH